MSLRTRTFIGNVFQCSVLTEYQKKYNYVLIVISVFINFATLVLCPQ